MLYLLASLLFVGCKESTSGGGSPPPPPPPAPSLDVGVRGNSFGCYFKMSSPVTFSATVAVGGEKRDTIAHPPGRFPLVWSANADVYSAHSNPTDSINVPGKFTLLCGSPP
jgi:hypothetical protein